MRGERTDVRLEPITQENVLAVCDLRVGPTQESFVTANAVSLAQAYVHSEAWCRAVYAGDDLVGFVMLHDVPTGPGYMLCARSETGGCPDFGEVGAWRAARGPCSPNMCTSSPLEART